MFLRTEYSVSFVNDSFINSLEKFLLVHDSYEKWFFLEARSSVCVAVNEIYVKNFNMRHNLFSEHHENFDHPVYRIIELCVNI